MPGGIPNRSTVCATFSAGASASAINKAISSCSNGVVLLNAGTYTAASLGGPINVYNSNVTLRGAGADKTILTGANIVNLGNGGNASLGTSISGATKGSKQFTAASTANLSVGKVIEVERDDDPNLVVGPTPNGKRNVRQVNVITAISGSTVTVRNPWFYDFSTGNPTIKFQYSSVTKSSGIENLKLNHAGFSGGGYNAFLQYCDSCWIKGVESGAATGYHFILLGTVNMELRDSFIHDGGSGPNNSGFNLYGNYQYGANSSAKIENNVFNKNFPAIELNGGSSGLFIGYNYSYGSPSQNGSNMVTWTFDDGHAPFNIMNLYEGNIGEQWGADNYYGGTGYGTALRNYFTGYNPNYGVAGDAVWLDRLAYNYNVIGNVLGSTNQKATAYQGCGINAIFRIGYPNLGNCTNSAWDGFTPPGGYPDVKVGSTLLRWGNYDYFSKATRFATSEVPSGVAAPSDQVIPKSYAYSAKPAWWPTNVAWPPIGPDVTGGNGDTSGHVNKIPAQVCWEAMKAGAAFNLSCFNLSASTAPQGSTTGTGSTTTQGSTTPTPTPSTPTPAPTTRGLFSTSSAPTNITANDSAPVELGVRFVAASNGSITGIRFYKGPQNVGAHTAHLWTASGTQLASATFSNETASGWQTVRFSSPVPITAGVTYVASYHANGFYSYNSAFFKSNYTNGPLTAPASGGNGVFAYGSGSVFPTNSYNANNYWVDVLFQ